MPVQDCEEGGSANDRVTAEVPDMGIEEVHGGSEWAWKSAASTAAPKSRGRPNISSRSLALSPDDIPFGGKDIDGASY
jgi:hypothetical protein